MQSTVTNAIRTQLQPVPAATARWLDCCLVLRAAPHAPSVALLPVANRQVVINLGDPLQLVSTGSVGSKPADLLAEGATRQLGIRQQPLAIEVDGQLSVVLLNLKPGCRIDADGLPGVDLLRTAMSKPDRHSAPTHLQRWLGGVTGSAPERTWRRVLGQLVDGAPVRDVAAIADLGSRQFRRVFTRVFGASPGQCVQLVRYQAALRLLLAGRSISDVATDLGYFDQPHMTRKVKRYSGLTPALIAEMGRQGLRPEMTGDRAGARPVLLHHHAAPAAQTHCQAASAG